ncbi:16268_t:CDS:1, partial [Racocetra fulgida]
MDTQLQESRIQLSCSDSRVQDISQEMLRNIRQEARNSEISEKSENKISKEENVYEILN